MRGRCRNITTVKGSSAARRRRGSWRWLQPVRSARLQPSGRRTVNVEPRPGSLVDLDRAAVRLDDGLDEAQAEAEAALGAAACRRGTADPRCAAARRRECRRRCRARAARAAPPSAPTSTSTRPPAGVYLTALSIRLAATCSSRVRSAGDDDVGRRVGARAPRLSPPRRRGTDRPRARRRRPARTGSRCSCIAPLSASEMSISVLSITSTRSDSSTQSASASRYRSTSGGARERHLRRAAQARQRRAQVVRHVVERAAHARSRAPRSCRASR